MAGKFIALGVSLLLCAVLCESRPFSAVASDSAHQIPLRVVLGNHADWGNKASYNLSVWRSRLFASTEKWIQSKGNNDKPSGKWERFELFQPFLSCPPGRPLKRVGPPGDGGKWLCDPAGMEAPCTILSLGSNMDFRFEEAMLKDTNCNIATFDCTCEGKILSPRHSFHKVCVGSTATSQSDLSILTYAQLNSMIHLDAPPVLKMDVESFEFPFLAEMHEHSRHLPEQIAVEIHMYNLSPNTPSERHPQWARGDLGALDGALLFMHMANLGYGIVSYEPNDGDGRCAEFTFFRVEGPNTRL